MKFIDVETWNRALHYRIFKDIVQPHYCVTFNLDITNFLAKVKEKGYSFSFALIYAITECANKIENFRYRFVDDKPVVFDTIDTRFTYLNQETELFKMVAVPMQDSMEAYAKLAKETAENQKEYFLPSSENNFYQFSTVPWISFTHVSHTDAGDNRDATPVFNIGKYFRSEGKVLIPFSVKVHHSFVDGVHVGKLAESLQEYMNKFE